MSSPQVQVDKNWMSELDKSVVPAAQGFLAKLMTDDTLPGLHIEPMKNPADPRVRTARVNDFWRAVMFKITTAHGVMYFVHKIYPHDKANDIAPTLTFSVNPVTGTPQFVVLEPTPGVEGGSGFGGSDVGAGARAGARAAGSDEPTQPPFLSAWNNTTQGLVENLGFAPDVAQRAMACTSENDVIELAALINTVHSDMLLSLATGTPISEVRIEFGLDAAQEFIDELKKDAPDNHVDFASDEVIVKATHTPLTKAQFTLIDGQDELKKVIEAGDFGAWRVFLHPSQRTYVGAQYGGPARLSGGAGTGKTVVLLHRTARLHTDTPNARIILTTYNKTLAQNLADNLELLDDNVRFAGGLGEPGVLVRGIDALAASVLKDADAAVLAQVSEELLGRPFTGKFALPSDTLWDYAATTLPDSADERIATGAFLRAEYEQVVLARGVTSQEQYRKVRRPGRGIALDRGRRDAVWTAIEAYKLTAEEAFSFAERLALATAYLETAGAGTGAAGTGVADHILVDEGQDFTAAHWAFVRALVAPGPNDIYIAEDANQRIYAQKIVLSHFGIRIVGRSRRLTLNYRTTQENLKYAVGILSGAQYEDLEGEGVDGSKIISARSGPQPEVMHSTHLNDAVAQTVIKIAQWRALDAGAPQSVAVLLPKKSVAEKFEVALAEAGIASKFVDNTVVNDPGVVQLMTMHRSKGMEFSRVVLFKQGTLLGGDGASRHPELSEAELNEQQLRNRSLLYVAATRARDELVVVE